MTSAGWESSLDRDQLSALLNAAIEDPRDVDARLVLADWLDEHGDARGTLVRLQMLLAEGWREDWYALEQAWLRENLPAWVQSPKSTTVTRPS